MAFNSQRLRSITPELRRLRILAVTPGRFQVAWLSGMLGDGPDKPLELDSVADPSEALDRIENGSSFDICFLDDAVGDRAVEQMLKTMHAWGYPFPVVLVTDPGAEEFIARSLEKGAADYLYRSRVELPELVRSIRYALDRHRLSAEARRWQKRYQSVWDRNHSGLYQIDADARVLDCNQRFANLLGYPGARYIIGRQLMEFAVGEDGVQAETPTPLARGTRPFWSREVCVQCRDGSAKWLIFNDSQVDSGFQDGDGAPVYEGWIRDQERERELEELLQRQESLFMSLFTAVAEAMIVLDDRGIVVSCNQAAERLLGEKLDRLLGRHITACFESYAAASGEELPASSLPAVQTLASGESSENDLVGLQLKSGDRIWARMRSAAVRLPGGASSSVIVSLVDQTQLQLLEEKLVDAQKLEVSSLAAHGMTHDLRNAVTSIGAMAELIEERDDDLAEAKRHAEQIRQAAGHAHSIVSQILGFTRNRTTQLAPVEVDGVMVGLRDLLRGMIPREISLEVDLRARGHRVLSTVGYVEQIILNLLINGRDAMLDGGKLTIESELVALLEPKTLGGRELSAGSYVLLTVTDEGVGMEAPVRQRAFEPFFTTKGQQEGTGLGLWSVRNLAQRGGGEAVIESSLGRGTIVRVYLPLVS